MTRTLLAALALAWAASPVALPIEALAQATLPPVKMPQPCGAVPSADTLNGSVGSANCYVPKDASRPTAVQAANVQTSASDGSWSVTWARPFVSPSPIVLPIPVNTGSLPLVCNVVSRSATGATGKCWQSTTTTLAGTLLGLVVNPFGTAAASAAVMVIGREPTQ